MRFFLILCVFLAGFATHAQAQEAQSLVKPGQTVLNISASERQTAQQDLLIASLRFETESTNSKDIQDKINKMTTAGLAKAKNYDKVQVSTDNYYVYPYDPNQVVPVDQQTGSYERKPVIWKGSQGIQLKSKSSDDLLKLMGELQEQGFQSSGLNYTLSPESFETIRDSMMETALKKLSEKANRAAKALGKKEAELVEVSVDTSYPNYPVPMMARAEMAMDAGSAKFAAPVASPGEAEITLTVSARAVLK